ncbi:MAG: polymer-forming cytoskeletal protein [Alphaproteobacteria bacterium]|nr:polymer-forming cytoskeletal protein [Alphaproteobacteria bacterium]
MFGRSEKKKPDRPELRSAPSLISNGLHIVGNLTSDGEVQIDGVVEGDINARSLTVGETASVIGEISADLLSVRGKVQGTIHAREVRIFRTAVVHGDVLHETIAIESGAFFEGHCRRAERPNEKTEPKLTVIGKEPPVALAPPVKPAIAG